MLKWLNELNSKKKFRSLYLADIPVDLKRIGEFRGERFPDSGPAPWLDRPEALGTIDARLKAGELTEAEAEICIKWVVDGYIIVPKLIEDDLLDEVWSAYEKAIQDGVITINPESLGPEDVLPGRKLDPHHTLPVIRKIQQHKKILAITDLLFGRKTWPFQTIMGHKGSSQRAHSDTVHMTTYPKGYLIANWIAFEDIHPDSGPLDFYPRSHRLIPPLLSEEIGVAPVEFKKRGGEVYAQHYEPYIQRYLQAFDLKPEVFLAKKGDVLFWHANLLHGGSPRKDLTLSRKALVCHYFAEGAVTYHDLSGNPSSLHKNGMYAPPQIEWL